MSPKITLSEDDKALFREQMRDVTPLNHMKKPTIKTYDRVEKTQETPSIAYDLSNYYSDPVQSESILSYHRKGLTHAQTQRFKSKTVTYEHKLDLHGFTTEDAKERLCQFIHHQIQNNARVVLIVHGKGGRFGEDPILKNLTNHWLRQIPDVLAFHSALPKHGGTGAVYVLLRRSLNV